MKKVISVLLSLAIVFSLSFCSFAGNTGTDVSAKLVEVVDRFFEKDFQLYNFDGENITELFYSTMTEFYAIGDYESIGEFLNANVEYAESSHSSRAVTCATFGQLLAPLSMNPTTNLTWDFYQTVDDEIHGYEDHNAIYGTAEVVYQYDSSTNLITRINSLNVDADLFRYYGDLSPSISVRNRSYSIQNGGANARFSFRVDADCLVQSDIYSEVNDLGLAFSYSASFSHSFTNLRRF